MGMPKDIDFPTSEVWSNYYAQKGRKSSSSRSKTPGEKDITRILDSLKKLTGFEPPKPESTPLTPPTTPNTNNQGKP
jgi:hypothetical protein